MSPSDYYYNRPARVPPPPDTLPFPGNLVRQCSDCVLRSGCVAPVPAENVEPHEVMFVGEAPGRQEDEWGFSPFCGQAGQYLDSLLFQCGISRSDVCLSNTCHCRPPNNRTPKVDEIQACAKWLNMELGIVQPRIIVALGKPATDVFLHGNGNTMEHLHGKPVEKDGRIILPCYHPAFALRDTSKMRQVSNDFQVLRGLVKGRDWREYHVEDEYPNPVYRVVDSVSAWKWMRNDIAETGEFAVDTEICRGKLWSVQISAKPGTAWFIPIPDNFKGKYDLTDLPGIAILHNYLFDVNYLDIREDDFVDSMTQAYLLGQPQGLKELASRLCGIQMINYKEMVRPGQQKLSLGYLQKASGMEWPDPPAIEETKWDNKKGCLTTKTKKPWHISRKIDKMLKDLADNSDTDLWDRWRNIPEEERAVVELVIGAMPESSLADIPFKQSVAYSCRDSDATLRVYHKLKKMITDLDLDFIQYLDLSVLPQVYEMMQNGMPVDIPYLKELSSYYFQNMEVAAGLASAKVGHPFNPNSSKQVAEVVYGELPFKPTKKTATGLISTDDQELKKVKHPVIADILEYRRNLKNKSTFADALVENAVPRQQGKDIVYRVHTTLKTTRTETGRLSSADPVNLQTMPTRSEDGKKIRKGFKASPGYRLTAGDFSQQEMRLQAHEAKCENLLTAYRNGVDVHTLTASRIFGVPMDVAEQAKYRYPAKCFHPDTEVLTPEGWKRIIDLQLGIDQVAQAIPREHGDTCLEWVYPTEVFTAKHPSGQLVHLCNEGMDLRVTPDHRMLAWGYSQKGIHHVVLPESMNKVAYWVNAGTMAGHISGMDEGLLRLAVATEADGSFSWRKVRFGFYDQRKIERLRYLAGNDVDELSNSNGSLRAVHTMRLNRDLSAKVRALLDVDKSFPWWWLSLSQELREVVLDELPYWDGGKYKRWKQYMYTSGNNKSRDVMQAMATITGRKAQMRGSELRIKDHAFSRGGHLGVNKYQYTGEVACLSVPSSFVLVRDRGVPVITGQTLNFSVIYIVSARGLYENIHEQALDIIVDGKPLDVSEWTEYSCQKLIDDWYKLNWEVKDWQMEKIAEARRFGYVKDIFGRRRYVPEISCPIRHIQGAGERMCVNFPIQGGCASITKLAMLESYQSRNRLYSPDDVRFIMAIHDELMLEVREDMAMEIAVWLKRIMDNVVVLDIPMVSEIKAGDNWAEMSKIKLEVEK